MGGYKIVARGLFNSKGWGVESMYGLRGGVWRPYPHLEKGLREIGIGLKCMFTAQFFTASSKKKI